MTMLLEDLAEETTASNLRAAERFDAEVRQLDISSGDSLPLEELCRKAVESARQATDYALARLPEVEGVWRSVLRSLNQKPLGAEADRLLRFTQDMVESGERLLRSSRLLWKIAEQRGAAGEHLDELDRAEKRFHVLVKEVNIAKDARTSDWKPADPTRLAQGLKLAEESQTVSAHDARARFRGSGDKG